MTKDAASGMSLGQRIISAARMAAEIHLAQLHRESIGDHRISDERQATRRRVAGGAELTCSRDGVPSASIFSGGGSSLSTGDIGGEAGGRRL